jgi:DNA-binding CsgD family transcriptional regulator
MSPFANRGTLPSRVGSSRAITRADSARTRDIAHALATIDDRHPTAVFDDVLPALRLLLRTEQTALFRFSKDDGEISVDRVHTAGNPLSEDAVRATADEHFRTARIWGLYDPLRPEPPQRNKPMVVAASLDVLAAGARVDAGPRSVASTRLGIGAHELTRRLGAFERTERVLLAPMGWALKKQLRVLLCDGPTLVAWIGAVGEAFGDREERLLGRVAPAFLRRARLVAQLEEGAFASAGLAAALDAMDAPAFIVSSRGVVRYANEAGRAMLGADGVAAKIADHVRGRSPMPGLDLTAFQASGMDTHWVAVLRGCESTARVDAAVRRWRLTAREGQVVALLVEGLANKEIADRLGCAVATVELHMTRALAKSRSASRLELVARVWRGA